MGHGDGLSIKVTGTSGDSNVSFNQYRFQVTPNHYYQINGFMKGANVSPLASCRLRIDFETSPSGAQVYPRNKDYLASVLNRYLAWGAQNNVPMYVGEFGLYRDCFAAGGIHFTYHAYHESAFGIYRNDSGLPDPGNANTDLINLFTVKLP